MPRHRPTDLARAVDSDSSVKILSTIRVRPGHDRDLCRAGSSGRSQSPSAAVCASHQVARDAVTRRPPRWANPEARAPALVTTRRPGGALSRAVFAAFCGILGAVLRHFCDIFAASTGESRSTPRSAERGHGRELEGAETAGGGAGAPKGLHLAQSRRASTRCCGFWRHIAAFCGILQLIAASMGWNCPSTGAGVT